MSDRPIHQAVDRTERAMTEVSRRMYSATATRLRPRMQPEVRSRSRGTVSDPTGAQVQSAVTDLLEAGSRLAELVRGAQTVRDDFGFPNPDLEGLLTALGDETADPEVNRRVDSSSRYWSRAVNVGCRFVSETPRLVRGWWVDQRERHGKLYALDQGQAAEIEQHDLERAWAAVRLSDEAGRLAGWLRPHERPLQPDLVYCSNHRGRLAKYRGLGLCGSCYEAQRRAA